jgi:hypothetical protein
MQRLDVGHPGEGDLVIGPAPRHHDGDFILAGALERPVMRAGNPLDYVERVAPLRLGVVDQGHSVSSARSKGTQARVNALTARA